MSLGFGGRPRYLECPRHPGQPDGLDCEACEREVERQSLVDGEADVGAWQAGQDRYERWLGECAP